MPNNAYRRGYYYERKTSQLYRADGWWTVEARGSHGVADVLALKRGEDPLLIQVKSGGTPFSGFGPAERKRFLETAIQAGARCVYVWWDTESRPSVFKRYWPEDWPNK